MSHDHTPSRSYATIELRKTRGRQKFRWRLRTVGRATQGPEESYTSPTHALRMARRGTGFVLDYADLSDPAFVKLCGHNPYYAIEVVGWSHKQAATVFGEDDLEAAARLREMDELPPFPFPL